MAVSYHHEPHHIEDPLYREGSAHLQAGAWNDAIRVFGELAERYPQDRRVRNALEMAQFKADLDASSRVKPKRTILPGLRLLAPVLVIVVVVGLVWTAASFAGRVLGPMIGGARAEIGWNTRIGEANLLLGQEKFDEALAKLDEVLAQNPDHVKARGLKATIKAEQDLAVFYNEGVAHQEAGDYGVATVIFQDINRRRADYKDVKKRLATMAEGVNLQQILLRAELLIKGDYEEQVEAVALYEQVRSANATYQQATVENRLVETYLTWGRDLVALDPPAPERMPEALAHFEKALRIKRTHREALAEHELASAYLSGEAAFNNERWSQALSELGWVYGERPDYLGGHVVDLLYAAVVELADLRMAEGRTEEAARLYAQAKELPVSDRSRAEGGLAQSAPSPTPTAVFVRQPAPVAAVAAPPRPTATPQPTPTSAPPALASLQGQIVFKSDSPAQPGIWAMDADGGNRRFLGNTNDLQRQFTDLRERESWSNGRKLFVRDTGNSPQIFVAQQDTPDRQLTRLYQVSYDGVWSPDGQRVTFVSQERLSDDIWTIWADGADPQALTINTWEWDKHPSWSPDSSRIVFWSNRTGVKQIYVMNGDGNNQQNISNTTWDEHSPIWVK